MARFSGKPFLGYFRHGGMWPRGPFSSALVIASPPKADAAISIGQGKGIACPSAPLRAEGFFHSQ